MCCVQIPDTADLPLVTPLAGQAVLLRPFAASDVCERYVGWLNDPEVGRYSNQRFRAHTTATCLAYLDTFQGTDNTFLAIESLASRSVVGTMTAYANRTHGTVDVGIMVGERLVWGTGLGQDAWNTCLAALFAVPWVRKVTAGTLAANLGMLRLMQRSGMVLEGVRRAQELLGGEPCDIHLYGRLRGA